MRKELIFEVSRYIERRDRKTSTTYCIDYREGNNRLSVEADSVKELAEKFVKKRIYLELSGDYQIKNKTDNNFGREEGESELEIGLSSEEYVDLFEKVTDLENKSTEI
ncbi:MAG: hypothetical protein WCK90_04615 [archaeon]